MLKFMRKFGILAIDIMIIYNVKLVSLLYVIILLLATLPSNTKELYIF